MDDTIRLYRCMSEAEFQSLLRTGEFSIIPGSLEIKWVAETPEHAAAWGLHFERVSGIPHRRIVSVEVDAAVAATMLRLPLLDNIGPARAATLADLSGARWAEYPYSETAAGGPP